jgi:uncharacterized protein (DUF1330 family)
MTVYIVAQLRFTDRERYERYQARFMDIFRKFDGRLLAADESPALLEGRSDVEKLVMMSFPDEAAARRFIEDAEYADISKDRHAGARTTSFLVKGLG